MSEPQTPLLTERNPVTHKAHRREVFWQITIPLILGVTLLLAVTGGVIWAGAIGVERVNRGANVSLIWLILLALALSLPVLMTLAALVYGLMRVLPAIPPYAYLVQAFFWRVQHLVRRGANLAVEPILKIQSLMAGVRALHRDDS